MRGRRPRRPARVRPPGVLLRDPDTVHRALSALSTTDGTAHWWPYAAAIATDHVMIHLAGAQIPEPIEPWLEGADPHIWVTDRVADQPPHPAVRLLLIGHTIDKLVFLDAARAPGPITVTGQPGEAGPVYDLLAAQLPEQALSDREIDTTHWPISVQGGTISLVGLPIAFVFCYEDALQAANFMREVSLAAFEDRLADSASPENTPQTPDTDSAPYQEPVPYQAAVTVPADPAHDNTGHEVTDLDVDAWLRSVKAAAEAALARKPTVTPQPVRPPDPTPKPLPALQSDHPGEPARLDDWADTAVSSAQDR